jgi:aminoglycoside phosphotransferase (APT) family kinase protein
LEAQAGGLAWPPPWRRPDLDQAVAHASGADAKRIAALATPFAIARSRAVASAPTVIHGELYPANVLLAGERVCVLDWESIARGPALLDLAALTAGRWHVEDDPLVEAYRSALPQPPAAAELAAELDACRLLVAVGWLAAPPAWTPPPGQARNWLADAELIAERMRR